MPPRRASIHLHQQPPPQEHIIPPPHNQPSTQILSAIAKGTDCPEFKDVPEMCLYQPMNTSIEAEPSHNIATSSQATERDLCQPPPQKEELDHVQIGDQDEEPEEEEAALEEEELARVQQEIERLRQETILRRQTAMQRAKASRQNISRERKRLTEMQYNLEILRQQGCEAPLHNQIPNQPPPPSPPHNHILHHPNQPPPPQTHPLQPPLPPQMGTIDPKSPLAEHLQLAPWPLHYGSVTQHKYHGNTDPLKFLLCYEAAIASVGGDKATLVKSLIISLEDATTNWYSRLSLRCIYSW
jgi:hypothetical protein